MPGHSPLPSSLSSPNLTQEESRDNVPSEIGQGLRWRPRRASVAPVPQMPGHVAASWEKLRSMMFNTKDVTVPSTNAPLPPGAETRAASNQGPRLQFTKSATYELQSNLNKKDSSSSSSLYVDRRETSAGDGDHSGDGGGGGGGQSDGGDFENFVAFDEIQRRERVWERVGFESEKTRQNRAKTVKKGFAGKFAKLRRVLEKSTKSPYWIILYYFLTISVLLGPPINMLYSSHTGNTIFGWLTLIAAILFLFEIVAKTIVNPAYLLSLVAFLDIIATLSMCFDISLELFDSAFWVADDKVYFHGYQMVTEKGLAKHLQISQLVCVLTLTRLYRMARALGMLLEHIRSNEMNKLEDEILYRRLQLMFACMDEDNDGYIWPNDFAHAMTYFGLVSEEKAVEIARSLKQSYREEDKARAFLRISAGCPPPPMAGMAFDEFKVEVLNLDRNDKLRSCARETLNQRTQTYAALATMAETTAIKMIFGFTILLISAIYLFNDGYGIKSPASSLSMIDSLYRFQAMNLKNTTAVLENQSQQLLASVPDRFIIVYYKIGGADGPWDIDRLSGTAYNNRRFFDRLLVQAGVGAVGPMPSSVVLEVRSLWIEFGFDSIFMLIIAAVLVFFASFFFMRSFNKIGVSIIYPLRTMVDRLEQLAVFEYAAVGNHEVFATTGATESGGGGSPNEMSTKNKCLAFLGYGVDNRAANGYFNEIKDLDQSLTRVQLMISSWAKYCPYDVVRMILRAGEEVELGVAPQPVTIFFSDIESFTTICEMLPPSQVLRFLSTYFTLVSEIITDNQGTLLEFLGDGILAVWNAPLAVSNHSERCLIAAMTMQGMVDRLSQQDPTWRQALKMVHKPTLRVRMGIHTGQCLVGNVGAPSRMKYGLLGDRVNTASRLENCNKRYDTSVIISESVWMEPGVADHFVCRPLDRVAVKGKSEGLTILEVMTTREDATPEQMVLAGLHIKALEAYRNRDFEVAIKLLDECEKRSRDIGDSWVAPRRLRDQAAYYRQHPPVDENWDGTTRLNHKSFDDTPQ
ncbi:Nitrogen permease regulator 2 [Perkinsus chesapeaki]|uniref:Nitrogen permease regulator 2 n=1 Tax=Perkinsus chesapeaki TaxID=330153 RepID=A0A7J6M3I2_PERCH|nr:Nitrogen permease regulator 2 [Perkinsus chesapeaki]